MPIQNLEGPELIVCFSSMMRSVFFSSLLFFLVPFSLLAQEKAMGIEIYAGGLRYPSFEAYQRSNKSFDSLTETGLARGLFQEKALKRGEGEASFFQFSPKAGRVAGIEPSFDDVWQGLYKEPLAVLKVSSPEEIRRDLEMRLGTKEPVVLIVSDRKKARVMGLKKDAPGPEGLGMSAAAEATPP